MNLENINSNEEVGNLKGFAQSENRNYPSIFGLELKLLTKILLIFGLITTIGLVTSISYNVKLSSYNKTLKVFSISIFFKFFGDIKLL